MLDKLYFKNPIWSIAIYKGKNIDQLRNIKEDCLPVLTGSSVTDVKASYVADPFIIKKNGIWYMFFEIYDEVKSKGLIGVAKSNDLINWKYERVVLEDKYHLSYPYVFEDKGEIYMIPEIGASSSVRLYKAKQFPFEWEYINNIVDTGFWDSSIINYNGIWYLFAHKGNDLHLLYSDELLGNWIEHPKSPIVKNNPQISRPAGRIINYKDKLIRYAQDKSIYYGRHISKIEILKLNKYEYEEVNKGVIFKGSDIESTWNKDGMHSIDIYNDENEFIAVLDGHYFENVNKIFNRIKKIYYSKLKK